VVVHLGQPKGRGLLGLAASLDQPGPVHTCSNSSNSSSSSSGGVMVVHWVAYGRQHVPEG
jgi:hypothetical protein